MSSNDKPAGKPPSPPPEVASASPPPEVASAAAALDQGCFNNKINEKAIAAIVCHKKLKEQRFYDLKPSDFENIFSEIVRNNNDEPIFIGSESKQYANGEDNAKYKIEIDDKNSLLITTDNKRTTFAEWAKNKKITELSNLILELYFTKGCRIFKMMNTGEIIMKVSNLNGTGPKLPNLKKSLISFFKNSDSLTAIKNAALDSTNNDLRQSINEIANDLFQIFSNKEGNKEIVYYNLFNRHNDSKFFSEIRTISGIQISYVTDERKPTASVNTTLYYPMLFYILYLQDLMKPNKLQFDEIKTIKNILNVIDPFDLVKMKERFDDIIATLDPRQFLVVNKFTKFKPKEDKACFLFHGVGTGKTITSLTIALSHLTDNNITEIVSEAESSGRVIAASVDSPRNEQHDLQPPVPIERPDSRQIFNEVIAQLGKETPPDGNFAGGHTEKNFRGGGDVSKESMRKIKGYNTNRKVVGNDIQGGKCYDSSDFLQNSATGNCGVESLAQIYQPIDLSETPNYKVNVTPIAKALRYLLFKCYESAADEYDANRTVTIMDYLLGENKHATNAIENGGNNYNYREYSDYIKETNAFLNNNDIDILLKILQIDNGITFFVPENPINQRLLGAKLDDQNYIICNKNEEPSHFTLAKHDNVRNIDADIIQAVTKINELRTQTNISSINSQTLIAELLCIINSDSNCARAKLLATANQTKSMAASTIEQAQTTASGLLKSENSATNTYLDKSESSDKPNMYEPSEEVLDYKSIDSSSKEKDLSKKPLKVLIIAPQGIFLGAFRSDCALLGIYTYNTQVNTHNGIDISSYSGAIKIADDNLNKYYEVEFTGMDYLNLWKNGAIDLLLSNNYDALICDEAHQLLLNELSPKSIWGFKTYRADTKTYEKGVVVPEKDPSNLTMTVIEDYRFLKFLSQNVNKQIILLTGTPIQKTPRDMLKIIYLLNCPALNGSNFEEYTKNINDYVKGSGSDDYYFAPHTENAVTYLTSYFQKSIALCHSLATLAGGVLNKKISKEDANAALIKSNSFAIIDLIIGEGSAKELTETVQLIKDTLNKSNGTIEEISKLIQRINVEKAFKILDKLEKILDWIDDNKEDIIQELPKILIPGDMQNTPDANDIFKVVVGGILSDENKGVLNGRIGQVLTNFGSSYDEIIKQKVKLEEQVKTAIEKKDAAISAALNALNNPYHFTAEQYNQILQVVMKIKDRKIVLTTSSVTFHPEKSKQEKFKQTKGGRKVSQKSSKKTLRTQRLSGKNKKILGGADPLTWGAFIYLGLTSAAAASLKASLYALFSYIVTVLFFEFKTINGTIEKLVEYTLYNIQLIIRALSGKGKESGGISGIIYNFFKGIVSIIYQTISAPVYALKYLVFIVISICGNLCSVILLLFQPDYKLDLMVKHLLPFTSIYNYDYMDNAIEQKEFYKTILENDYKIIEYVNSEGNSNTFPKKHIENIYVPYDDVKAFNMTISGKEIDSLVDGRRYTDAYKLGIRDVQNLEASILDDEQLTKESYELNRRFLNYFCGVGNFNIKIVNIVISSYNDAEFKEKRKNYGSRFNSGVQLGNKQPGTKDPGDLQYNLVSNSVHKERNGEKSIIKDGELKVIPINISSNYSKPIETIKSDHDTITKLLDKIKSNSESVNKYLYSTPTPDDIKVTGDVLGSDKDDTSKHFENALRLLLVMKTGSIAHNGNLCLQPHYICKKSAHDITVEYYLPIIYPPTEEVMYGFCNYLNKKNYKYIFMCNKFDSEQMQAQVEYAQIFTYPIGGLESNKETGDPICVIISPNHKEGFSFTFNPALITFGLSDTAGDEEQIYGRVLRKYGTDGFKGKYDKKLYQYFNGGSKNQALIGWISLLNKIDNNSTYRDIYSKVIYNTKSWVPTSILKPVYLLRQAIDTFFRSNLLLPEGARRLAAVEKYNNEQNSKLKDLPELPEREKLEGIILDIFLQSEVSSFYQESQLQILTSVKTTSLSFFQTYASLETKIRGPDEMSAVSGDIITIPGDEIGIQPSDLTSIIKTPADELTSIIKTPADELTYCIQNLKDIGNTSVTDNGNLTLKNCLVCVPNLEGKASGERVIHRQKKETEKDNERKEKLFQQLRVASILSTHIGDFLTDIERLGSMSYDDIVNALKKLDKEVIVSRWASRRLNLFLPNYDPNKKYSDNDYASLIAINDLRTKKIINNIALAAAIAEYKKNPPSPHTQDFGGTRHYKKPKSRSSKRRTRKYKTRK